MSKDTAWVAFKAPQIIPGSVLGKARDQPVNPGDPVELPIAYARHVVDDGFAVPSKKPRGAKAAAQEDATSGKGEAQA